MTCIRCYCDLAYVTYVTFFLLPLCRRGPFVAFGRGPLGGEGGGLFRGDCPAALALIVLRTRSRFSQAVLDNSIAHAIAAPLPSLPYVALHTLHTLPLPLPYVAYVTRQLSTPKTPKPRPLTLNPQPSTPNPQPPTPNSQPSTLNPKH